MDVQEHKGWYKRTKLPHFDAADTYQMITYRLIDSMPSTTLNKLKTLRDNGDILNKEYRAKVEYWLDQGMGACVLKDEDVAEIVINNWKHWHEARYELLNWVVMPNHVHVLIKQYQGVPTNKIIHSWKSYSSNAINKYLKLEGEFWCSDYWDRYVRDEQHYKQAFEYIDNNPVKAGLVARAEDWRLGRFA